MKSVPVPLFVIIVLLVSLVIESLLLHRANQRILALQDDITFLKGWFPTGTVFPNHEIDSVVKSLKDKAADELK